MFAALFFERDPLQLSDFLPGLLTWVQDAGGFAMFGLVLWLLLGLPRMRPQDRALVPGWKKTLFTIATIGAFVCYPIWALFLLASLNTNPDEAKSVSKVSLMIQDIMLTCGGLFAMTAVGLPFIHNLFQMRFRRIFALAKLSFKEAVRRRVLYAFSGLLLVFLFTSWFVLDSKPEDQVRTYVSVVFLTMTGLLLVTSVLMTSFSIPADIRQQTIHTIVTKPVERFEVVLGRFLGFLALMTVVLLIMTGVSLLYVLRGVNPEAAAESLKARVPVYGDLYFENTGDDRKAVNVGREWDYRSYITIPTPGQEPPTARWDFASLPRELANRDTVRCEFSFDVYRTTKGRKENTGVECAFEFRTWRFRKGDESKFRSERQIRGLGNKEAENELAEKYGYYEVSSLEVTDFHTQYINLPGGLFRNAFGDDPQRLEELKQRGITQPPVLDARVRCTTRSPEYVGMAKYDFYVRQDQPGTGETLLFAGNFFKAAFGLWLRLALAIGLAVVLSTYLSGVISALVTGLLFLGGFCKDFIRSVGLGNNVGGGPLEAMVRLARRELSGPTPDSSGTTADRIVAASDESFRWVVRRILDVIPEIDRFDLTNYVAEGFNIGGTQLLMSFLLLIIYMLPWAVLAFYLIKWREVASSN